jgi:hypothetical protein
MQEAGAPLPKRGVSGKFVVRVKSSMHFETKAQADESLNVITCPIPREAVPVVLVRARKFPRISDPCAVRSRADRLIGGMPLSR